MMRYITPTFQLRNTNSTMEESEQRVDAIQELCLKTGKELVLYLSMGFGNPYNDPYDEDILLHWAGVMAKKDIRILSLADTVGLATPAQISEALTVLIPQYPAITIGVHLHSTPQNWETKLTAALEAGCRRFDGALKGIGGCPMAQDELVGNMDTLLMIGYFQKKGLLKRMNEQALQRCLQLADSIFQ